MRKRGSMNLTDRQKLSLIDGLTLLYEDGPKTHEQAEKILGDIYRISHPSEHCPHENWEKEAVQIALELKEHIVDVWEEHKDLKDPLRTITPKDTCVADCDDPHCPICRPNEEKK